MPKGDKVSRTRYTRQGMTAELTKELISQHGSLMNAARAIVSRSVDPRDSKKSASLNAVRLWMQEALAGVIAPRRQIYDPAREELVNQVANLLEEANIDPDSVEKFERTDLNSGFHEVVTRGPKKTIIDPATGKEIIVEGDPVVTRARSKRVVVRLTPKWKPPAWPVVQPAPPVVVKYAAPTVIIPKGLRVEVVHPDTQIGFQRNLNSRTYKDGIESYLLEPIHDEVAIDVALQLTAAIQPDGFTHVGDLLDLSEFSKYLQVEEFWRTTQQSIDYGHQYLARVKSAIGEPRKGKTKKLRLIDGNHDWNRLATYIQLNARAAFGLKPVMSTPDDWPDLSFPRLLLLDELGYEQCGMWPGSSTWLVEGKNALVVVHDPKRLGYFEGSVISGHTHKHEERTFSVNGPMGERTFSHYSIGCLCSLKRVENKGSIQRTKVPSDRGFVKDWSQGICVVEILEKTGQHRVEFVPIVDGVAIYRGQKFEATQPKAKAA